MRKEFTTTGALTILGLAVGALASAASAFALEQVTVVSAGGSYQVALRQAIIEPFSKATGIKVIEGEFNDEISKIRAMVETNTVSWDAVDVSINAAASMCNEGLAEQIDWQKLNLERSRIFGADRVDCSVPYVIATGIIAYDKNRLPNGPKTIADFFDTKKFPGKRGLKKTPYGNLEWALIADGVPVKDVYKVLEKPEGVDRAFKKLDTIKRDVVWYVANAQPPQFLADGQVVMTGAAHGRIYDANKNSGKNFGVMWDAAQWEIGSWVIPKGSPNREAAYKFIAFAGSPQAQADLVRYVPYGPANKDAIAFVDTAILPDLPTAPEHMGNFFLRDAAFWAEKSDELNQRFTAWLAN